MIVTPILLLTAITLVIAFLSPKQASALLWLILFTYPRNWSAQHLPMPLNIGIDDLLCILIFLVVVIRRHLLEGIGLRLGYGFWVITGFAIVATIANVSGATQRPDQWILYLEDIIKVWIYWCLFYAIIHCIDDLSDLRIQLTAFSVAAAIGAFLVLLDHFWPHWMVPWSNTSILTTGLTAESASGPFLGPNLAACVIACSIPLMVGAVRLGQRLSLAFILWPSCILCLIALLSTQSRSGMAAFLIACILMAIFSRQRYVAIALIVGVAVIGLLASSLRSTLQQPSLAYSPVAWPSNLEGRIPVWHGYIQNATAKTYIFGQGHSGAIANNGLQGLSTYISLVSVYGLGGLSWAIGTLAGFFRKIRARPDDDPGIAVVRSVCLWSLVVWLVYAATSDAISCRYPRHILFYLVVLLDRADSIAAELASGLAYWDQFVENSLGPIEPAQTLNVSSTKWRLPKR